MDMDQKETSTVLEFLDRLVKPLTDRIERMDAKLDQVVHMGERVAATEAQTGQIHGRLTAVEGTQSQHSLELAEIRGRSKVIQWILGLIGAPIVVALACAGIAALFGIKL